MGNPIQPASEVVAELQGTQPETEDLTPKERREYVFNFEHKDDRGRLWKGSFTNQILSPSQKIRVGAARALICGNVPFEALDPYTREYSERIAYLSTSLIKRPKWARELGDLLDVSIIDRLYEEVMSHEATFHGRGADQEKSEAATTEPTGGAEGVAQRTDEDA